MELLIFALITLVSFGNFVDFAIGPRGNARLKGRLIDGWMLINGDWRRILPAMARKLGGLSTQSSGRSHSLAGIFSERLGSAPP